MDKKTIIDEVFSETRKYLDENLDWKIETLNNIDDIPNNCAKCENELAEIYCRNENQKDFFSNFDLVVLKCSSCKAIYAYWLNIDFLSDNRQTPLRRSNIQKKYKNKALGKNDSIPKIQKRLNKIIDTKIAALYNAGINLDIINSARHKVVKYIGTSNPPPKRLEALFFAAIYTVSNRQISNKKRHFQPSLQISERSIEKISGISRKTIRKWKIFFE